jgi:hypothetical protein
MTIDLERLAVDADYWDEVAPEGATHFMYSEKFVKWVDGVEWAFYTYSDKAWKQATLTWPLQKYTDNGNEVVAKPKSHPTDTQPAESGAQISAEWDGTGLPPVGCECKAVWLEAPDGGSREYKPVLVKGYFKSEVLQVWFCTQQGEDIVCRMNNCSFWTIRSQAERERDTAIDHAFSKLTEFREAKQVLGDLYDAGMLQMPDEDVAKKARGES